MRTRTALAAIAAVAALTISACDSGTTVTDKPNTATPKAASSSKPAAEPSTAAPAPAGVGDTITLKGSEDGSQLDVTVVKVADPARSSDEYTSPEDGNRWVGVQFRLLNSGSKAYGDSPANGAQIYDKHVKAGDPSSPRWGMSGWYASVVSPGPVAPGDPIETVAVLA